MREPAQDQPSPLAQPSPPDHLPRRARPELVEFAAADGYLLRGQFRPAVGVPPRLAVLINPATGVLARYYDRYAEYLASRGCSVLTYDYRGIGASRNGPIRKLRATKFDWGNLDCDAALRHLRERVPGTPLAVVGHSIGGFLLGLAKENVHVERAFFVGAQYAYWRDYLAQKRFGLFLRWHVFMPLVTALLGYFPGRRLDWLEDLPRGVAYEWGFRLRPHFDAFYHRLPHAAHPDDLHTARRQFAGFAGKILSVSTADDEYATPRAVERLLSWFESASSRHVSIDGKLAGPPGIGHFGFFHDRLREVLWPQSADWLLDGDASGWNAPTTTSPGYPS